MDIEASLLNLTQDALIVRDFDDCIRFWNKGAERLYGWRAEEAIGQNINDLLHESLAPGFDGVLRENGDWTGELRQVTKEGNVVFVKSHVTFKRDQAGYPQCVLIANTDITHLKTVERELLRAQRMATLGKLASRVMHDLNNELSLTLFSTRVLDGKQDTEVRRWLEMFRTSLQHSGCLISQLLSFGQGSDKESTLIRAGNLIEETEAMLRGVLPKPIEIKTTLPAGLWPIAGNATDLRQVIINLCVNACDAMPRGGVLTIEAENYCPDSRERRVCIRIADTGLGMVPGLRSRIFEPLFTTKGGYGGKGLV